MNIKDFHASLEYLFKAELTGFIWGHAGIGKSSIIKQYAQEKGYHFFPLYLGTQSDLGDVLGLQDFRRDKDGTAIASVFAPPAWLVDMIAYCEENPSSGAILFLDEFNRARRDIINGMFSLALDKTFHTIKLPKNCHIIAAGNPPTDEYYTTDVNETALMARFIHIKLEPTVEEWVTYAREAKFEETLVSFVQSQPQLLEDGKSSFDLPVKVDRRAYSRMNRLYEVGTPENLRMQLMRGILGLERTIAFEAHLASDVVPMKGEDILKGGWESKIKGWSSSKDIKSSLLSITSDNLMAVLKTRGEDVNEFEIQQTFNFIFALPPDLAFALVSKLHKDRIPAIIRIGDTPKLNAPLVKMLTAARGLKNE